MDSTSLRRIVRRVSTLVIALAAPMGPSASGANAQSVVQIQNFDGTILASAGSLYTTYRHCAPTGGGVPVCEWYVRKLYGDNAAVVVTINVNGGDPACYSGFTQYVV